MRSLHILFLISPLSHVAAQDCDPSDPFGANCDDSGPAIAIDGEQNLCNFILTACPGGFPAATDCVTNWCKTGCADPNNCCASSNPSSCFQSSSATPSSSEPSSGSDSGSDSDSEAQDPGVAECTSIADFVNYCQSATPGFTTLPNTAQASCFCFNENGSYNGTAWDDAATTCYAAMASQTGYPTSELSAYSATVVGACTKLVDAGVLSSAGVSSAGAAATAAPAASGSPSGSSTAAKTSSASSGANTGTTSPTATASSAKSGANKGSQGRGTLFGAILAVSCIFASL
ncbi:hypothetical protein HO133_004325 [Letharia lupina]|uniref:Uncharacterized protein n=1 Tax=Letharia lupina TaxID=560253 RepID=A0A8H6FK50_9LECA|nr:uncharacterized protein HO133_004325 [Letharia lupina]KAF6229987.1 hypothetical protein HO133_004325 [Letharia lupina]